MKHGALAEAGPLRLAAVVLQLGLLLLLFQVFELESRAFLFVGLIGLIGLPFHHFLPLRLRLPFFVLLSLAGIVVVLGWRNAAWLVATGAALIGLVHLPVRLSARLGLLGAAAAALAALRAGWVGSPWPEAVWPVLGSMFMFRLAIYVYDLRHRTAPFGPWRALAYFFMLPNVCFPLFPVVDYKTFCATYHNEDRFTIYHTGLSWMLRGTVHLLVYRLVYQNLLVDPSTIADAGDLARHVVTNFLLYLRISGTFHLVVGFLHLYGFNLSETHHRFLLAASFADVWRRLNIYWRDFMMKLVFYPLVFRLKRAGRGAALVLATAATFLISWLLHSYQWFWLRGSFPLTWQDALFWSVFGGLVVWRSLADLRRGRRKSLTPRPRTLQDALTRGLATVGVFVTLCLLWSLWTSESLGEWWSMLGRGATHASLGDALWIVGGLAALGLAGVTLGGSVAERTEVAGRREAPAASGFWRTAGATTALCALLLPVGYDPSLLDVAPSVAGVAERLRSMQLNERDEEAVQRGYYEELTDLHRASPELWKLYTKRSVVWKRLEEMEGMHRVDDLLAMELPASGGFVFKGVPLSTNRWAMRDREYEKTPPPGTHRVLLLGASVTMGGGVEDDQTYENVLEDRLNRDDVGEPWERYEILNMAVGGLTNGDPFKQLWRLESRGFDFEPDAVFFVAHASTLDWTASGAAQPVCGGAGLPWEAPAEIVRQAGVAAGDPLRRAQTRLRPYAEPLLRWVLTRVADECRERGIAPYLVYLPRVRRAAGRDDVRETVTRVAREAGLAVLDVSAAYAGIEDRDSLSLAPWDGHPNAEGNRLLADELYRLYRPYLKRAATPAETR